MHPIVPLSAITSVSFCSMFDVGGQRIERRKWIQCFNGLLNVFCNIAIIVLQMYVSEKSQSHWNHRLRWNLALRIHSHASHTRLSITADMITLYRSLAKDCPQANYLSNLLFNHERATMSCLQWLNALKAKNTTNNNVPQSHQWLWSQMLTAHNTLNSTILPWTSCSLLYALH